MRVAPAVEGYPNKRIKEKRKDVGGKEGTFSRVKSRSVKINR